MNKKKKLIVLFLGIISVLASGFALPEKMAVPVQGATSDDWNHQTFWYYPWGKSIVHKGIDVFAMDGTPITASTAGFTVFSGEFGIGGNVVVIIGPKWRFHYYAHMSKRSVGSLQFVKRGKVLGEVGESGNAKGKPPHLHYSIFTPIPYLWQFTKEPQGYLKVFFVNPHQKLIQAGI